MPRKMLSIPFGLPLPILRQMGKPLGTMGARMAKGNPLLSIQLNQAEITEVDDKEYTTLVLTNTIFWTVILAIVTIPIMSLVVSNRATALHATGFMIGGGITLVLAALIFFMGMSYPTALARKKIREIESNLIFALRTLLVQIKSGVSLFSGLDMVANGDFGALSREFKHAVDKMNAGYQQEEALQEIATNNPSPFLRKILWQIVNGMKAGGDIGDILSESMATTERDQKLAVTKYGNDLKLFSLIYLMIGVIMPALSMTFMIVLGSFPKVEIVETYFWGLLGMTLLMEFMFITMVESKRPTLMNV